MRVPFILVTLYLIFGPLMIDLSIYFRTLGCIVWLCLFIINHYTFQELFFQLPTVRFKYEQKIQEYQFNSNIIVRRIGNLIFNGLNITPTGYKVLGKSVIIGGAIGGGAYLLTESYKSHQETVRIKYQEDQHTKRYMYEVDRKTDLNLSIEQTKRNEIASKERLEMAKLQAESDRQKRSWF